MKDHKSMQPVFNLVSYSLTIFRKKFRVPGVAGLILMVFVCLPAKGWGANLHYALDVQVNIEEKKIDGIARLKVDSDEKIHLTLGNLRKIKVNGHDPKTSDRESISLALKRGEETVISYEAHFPVSAANIIESENVFLMKAWYPQPDDLAEYELSATLPKAFIANSEAEAVTVEERGQRKSFIFHFKHPLDALHLAASTRYVLKKDRFNNIAIETYFFKEDAELANTYIDYTKKYLAMYEKMLTPYPYQRFAVVENIFPSGYSMPTYTLLGSQVVQLPFIVKTSLGHEILHQWFGNYVYIDFAHGNWAEGLTSYLADHNYAAMEGKGSAYRKQILVNYDSYVNPENATPLSHFSIRRNKAQSAIGYGKSAMMFHWLRERFADEIFFVALREFIHQNRFRMASWHDIQRAFEKSAGEKLFKGFGYWLTEKDVLGIRAEDVELIVDQGQLKLNFTLLQPRETFPLDVPITLYSGKVKTRRVVKVKGMKNNISLKLDAPPDKVIIDEDYSLMRELTQEEIPPVLAGIMGKKNLLMVAAPGQDTLYQPLIEALGVEDITHVTPDDLTFTGLKENTVLIAGYENTIVSMLFGKQRTPKEGVRLRVYKNPYNADERIMLLYAKNRAEAEAVQRKIGHYGKYTELAFNGGKNTYKSIAKADNGIPVFKGTPARVTDSGSAATLDDMVTKLAGSRVIYIGERHDQFAHHINQLQIIKKLHETGQKLAVGMEMFRMSYQQTIDAYISGRMDERTFLKESGYFKNWGYDYNLYKPIIDYLKEKRIPIVALNIDRDITRKVAREGIYGLTDERKKQLPSALDFSDDQYRRDLNRVFPFHTEESELREFNYFFQAQIIWDEGMAETAHRFMSENPDHRLVILAGNGHVRYKYGIPERLLRRNQKAFTVIVQDETFKEGKADYIIRTSKLKGRKSPKLGVMVEEKDLGLTVVGVSDKSPAKKAGLKKGDIIRTVAGQPIKSLTDLKLGLFYHKRGRALKVQFERGEKKLNKEIEFP